MNTVLKVNNVEKYYGSRGNVTKAIDGISMQVEQGEFVGIMGPSGSGKTTLLNCISTIDKVTSGGIVVDNKEITTLNSRQLSRFRREELGFIFQDFNLLDTLTAYENIALALTILKVPHQEIDRRIKDMAQTLGIGDILDKYLPDFRRAEAARGLCTRNDYQPFAGIGGRTDRRAGFPGVPCPAGKLPKAQPGNGRDHHHGHP